MARKPKDKPEQRLSTLNLSFSFEYYDTSEENLFCLSGWSNTDVKHTLGRLKEICKKTLFVMQNERNVYHFFPTDWSKSPVYPNGFPEHIKELNNLDPFHFAILGLNNQKARVFGAVSGSTFYIVWFDYNHDILPVKLKYT